MCTAGVTASWELVMCTTGVTVSLEQVTAGVAASCISVGAGHSWCLGMYLKVFI